MVVLLLGACDDSTNINVTPETVVFSVNAGDDQQINMDTASATVVLSGSSSGSGDLTYQWQQTLGPVVSIADENQANTAFLLPEVTTDTELRFILTATAGTGHAVDDEVSIFIEAPVEVVEPDSATPAPATGGFEVTDPNGNTATRDALAWFGVRLTVEPVAEVSIAVQSSDPSQGQVEVDTLTFTPTNWDSYQQVQVRGVSPSADGGRNYHIRLGAATSTDSNYAGVDPVDVHMRGIVLEVAEPQLQSALLATQELDLSLPFTYTGTDKLTFTLLQAPEGATLDFFSGRLRWTPKREDRGRDVDFRVRVTDGSRFVSTDFSLGVLGSRSLNTELNATGTKLLVVDADSNLDGMSIGMRSGTVISSRDQATIEVVSGADLVGLLSIPESIIRVSDAFIAREQIQGALQIEVPFSATLAEAQQQSLVLYSYESNIHSNTKHWAELSLARYIVSSEEAPEKKLLRLKLWGLDGLFFVGYKARDISIDSSARKPTRSLSKARAELLNLGASAPLFASVESISDATLVACSSASDAAQDTEATASQRTFATDCNSRDTGQPRLICESSAAPELRVCINSDGTTQETIENANSSVWSGSYRGVAYDITLRQVIGYLVDARVKADELGMSYDETITVRFETITSSLGADIIILGLVRPVSENGETIHLRSSISGLNINGPGEIMKGVTVHEFFHHSQVKTIQRRASEDGYTANTDIGENRYAWVVEGTALWFEDLVYDDLQTYLRLRNRQARIMEVGLNASAGITDPIEGANRYDSYQRFLFFKLLSGYCSNFTDGLFEEFLAFRENDNLTGDISALENAITIPQYGCNFGNHLGSSMQSSIATAMTLFQYATLFRNDFRAIEENEPDLTEVETIKGQTTPPFIVPLSDLPVYTFEPTFPSTVESFPESDLILQGPAVMPPVSAYSFKIPVWNDITDNQFAQLEVQTDSDVFVSFTSSHPVFTGPHNIGQGEYSQPSESFFVPANSANSFVYNFDNKIPELFVTIANQSLTSTANPQVSFRIGEAVANAGIRIFEPLNGARVFNRVTSIRGEISEALRTMAVSVRIIIDGMQWEVTPDANGTFSTDVVIRLGQNIIQVQALDGAGIALGTNEIIAFEGVESTISGRNTLVPSGAVFILRWDNMVDMDIYSINSQDTTIWYENKAQGNGILDFDVEDGYGPEVISYGDSTGVELQNDTISIDVHYFEGDENPNFTLDVLLNEVNGNFIRRSYSSTASLSNPSGSINTGVSSSADNNTDDRINSVILIECNEEGICDVTAIDDILQQQ